MPKLKEGEKRVFLSFKRPDDLALLERLERDAEKQRYPIGVYIMLVLLEAYRPIDNVAQDALQLPHGS